MTKADDMRAKLKTRIDVISEDEALRRLGEGACIHCRGGFGRIGLIAALLLLEAGLFPQRGSQHGPTSKAGSGRDSRVGTLCAKYANLIWPSLPPRSYLFVAY